MISLGFLAGIPVILFCCITQICNMWCYPAMGDSSLINKCKWWRWGMFCRTKSCACRGIGISRKEWLALFSPVYESDTGIFKVSKRKGEWFSGSLLSLIVICENLALSFKPSVLGDCVFYGLRRIFPFLGSWSFSPFLGYVTVLSQTPVCSQLYTHAAFRFTYPAMMTVSKIHQRVIISKAKASNVQASNLPLKISTCSRKHKTSNDLLFWMPEGWKHFWNLVCSLTIQGCLGSVGQN